MSRDSRVRGPRAMAPIPVEEEEKEKGERMVKVVLWCVQYLPNARPMMSSVVKMLERGFEIGSPPNPFAHLQDNNVGFDKQLGKHHKFIRYALSFNRK
ncbi:LEAF RUST 10 DISEASE-RESISTANCE LOCUS RECEPTOR-LIKE PROTEIN KINASE-like 2.3 [Bienertia sinuspersici]